MKNPYLSALMGLLILMMAACSGAEEEIIDEDPTDEEETDPEVQTPTFDILAFDFAVKDSYQVTGETTIELSFDQGTSWKPPFDTALESGSSIWARVINSELGITEDNFNIDWSGSSVEPIEVVDNIAKFVLDEDDILIDLEIEVLFRLIVSGLDDEGFEGGLYELNLADASKTLLSDSIDYTAESMGYDSEDNVLYFVRDGGQMAFRDLIGQFDLVTKKSSLFYSGEDIAGGTSCNGWNDARGVEVLGEEVLAVGSCEGDDIFYFSQSSGESTSTPELSRNTGVANVSVDLRGGMCINSSKTDLLLGVQQSDFRDGQNPIYTYGFITNKISGEYVGFTALDFSETSSIPESFDYITDMTMTPSGTLYAIIESTSNPTSGPVQYLVTIDPSNGKVSDIGVLSEYSRSLTRLYGLTYVPKYAIE
ncbi:hypothetical protein [Reichenbachiella versicolor]|uniref:hypothetical protein n=1 Tax=Reichenbachiella versicolor TaxID=1821036 RepID=UPI000D6E33E4|nr:hypothetical protein [Reichenbachiella versicolor]